jgi:UDP-N-acetylglucosamine diphosphorylase/glucosamine-1-phosphate N-acetyltransferase
MRLNLSDHNHHLTFAPITLTKPVGLIRTGLFTNVERYKSFLPELEIGFITESYLNNKYTAVETPITVHGNVIPNEDFIAAILNLNENECLIHNNDIVAVKGNPINKVYFKGENLIILSKRWHIFQKNAEIIARDFKRIAQINKSRKLSDTNRVIGNINDVFIEEGAKIECSILNTTNGPIYIGQNAEIMEGCLVRGPFSLGENAVLKMGTKVYEGTSIGPGSKVGGELNNVVFHDNSNKAHDGFLGNSIIGSWCNLGADTNCSNLKNNYGLVSTYNFEKKAIEKTDIQFMGITMGDYSKCGINTMFNTGTVVGVSCNIFGAEFPDKFLKSFSWGLNKKEQFDFGKAIEAANNMLIRRNQKLEEEDIKILESILHNSNP